MAAPEHVPTGPVDRVRSYESPPRRAGSWRVDRPADFADERRQPDGDRLGNQGPDQGYALKLADLVAGELELAPGEHLSDALAGIVAVALKRASSFGRAPVIHDLRVAATVFGFSDPDADPALVRWRTDAFEEVGHPHHYMELRAIADAVPEAILRESPEEVRERYRRDWRELLDVDA